MNKMITSKRFSKRLIQSAVIVLGLYLVLQALSAASVISAYFMQLIMFGCINIIMTLSLQIINGYTGQYSIGQAGFMSLGAYCAAGITTLFIPASIVPDALQIPLFLLCSVIGGLFTALVAYIIGLPCLKLKGDYLAIVTLGVCEIVRTVFRMLPTFGGPRGMTQIPGYTNFSLIYIITILFIVLVRNFVNSPQGRACISVRENELASDTLGINTYRYKMMGFVIAAFIAGVAGSMFAHVYGYIQPDQFNAAKSNDILIYMYFGGAASISGSIISAMLLTFLPEVLRFLGLSDWRLAIYAVLLIIIMLRRPNGMFGSKEFPVLRVKNYIIRDKGEQEKS